MHIEVLRPRNEVKGAPCTNYQSKIGLPPPEIRFYAVFSVSVTRLDQAHTMYDSEERKSV